MKKSALVKLLGCLCLISGSYLGAAPATDEGSNVAVVGILTQEIIDAQPAPSKIREGLYQRAIVQPLKTTYELVPSSEGLGFSFAVTDVVESVPHYHSSLIETYTGVYGSLEVFIDDKSYIINPGDVIAVPKNTVHWVRSVNGETARMLVGCVPGWTPDDNHLITENTEVVPSTQVQLTPNTLQTAIVGLLGEHEEIDPVLNEVPSHLYQRRMDLPFKTVRELIPANEGLGFSVALMDIVAGEKNYHLGRSEIYTVVSGIVQVYIDGVGHILERGDVIAVPLKAVHFVRSLSEKSRVLVSCIPGWIPEDHHVVE